MQEQIKRMFILLKATKDIISKCDEGPYVKDVMSTTAIWDEAECDGGCLLEEITDLLEESDKDLMLHAIAERDALKAKNAELRKELQSMRSNSHIDFDVTRSDHNGYGMPNAW